MVILNIKKKNKKAWVKMIEVFIAIMLMTAALVLVLNKNVFTGEESKEIEYQMNHILRTVQSKNLLREEILDASLPTEWEEFNLNLPSTQSQINSLIPPNLNCEAKICALNDDCINTNSPLDKNVYSRRAYISADLDTYNPRQLKLFCWRK